MSSISSVIDWPKGRFFYTLLLFSALWQGHLARAQQATDGVMLARLITMPNDSAKVEALHQMAETGLRQNDYTNALKHAEEAIQVAGKTNNGPGKAASLLLAGRIGRAQGNVSVALNYLIQAKLAAETQLDLATGFAANTEIAQLYFQQRAYEKAVAYYNQALAIALKQPKSPKYVPALENVANTYFLIKDYANAKKHYLQLLNFYKKQENYKGMLAELEQLVNTDKLAGKIDNAIAFCNEAMQLAEAKQDFSAVAELMTDLGFLYQRQGKHEEAIGAFKNSLAVHNQYTKGDQGLSKRGDALGNQGIIYDEIKDYKNAFWNFDQALLLKRKASDVKGEAKIQNLIGAAHFGRKDYPKSIEALNKAVTLAMSQGATDVLQESYRLLSEVYLAKKDSRGAQTFLKNYQSLKDSVGSAESQLQQQQLQIMLDVEKRESEIRMLLTEKEKQDLALKQLELEAEKQEQILSLLGRDQELQATRIQNQELEKNRLRQTADLTSQQLLAARRDGEIIELQRTKEAGDFELKQKRLEDEKQKAAISLLEGQQKLQEVNLDKERDQRRLGNWIMALLGLVIGLGVIGFVQKQRANRKLNQQQNEILEKNDQLLQSEEELRQNMEELQTTQEAMQLRQHELEVANNKMAANEVVLTKAYDKIQANGAQIKEQNAKLGEAFAELNRKNIRITDSIRYAERIQKAIMPTEAQLTANFVEHFTIYKPKDVVSGDFYWFSKVGNKRFIAVVDCTGHGVPGAFMSMIGNTLLNQIINEKDIYTPHKVLENMDANIRQSLKQQDASTSDGMDIGLCCIETWEDGTISLKFAGAKISLWYTVDGQIHTIKADRVPLGGVDANLIYAYSPHTVRIEKGSTLYMATDGYMDASNVERQRFGSARLVAILAANQHLSLAEQGTLLEDALREYQADGHEQRDDITMLAVKV